MRHQRTSGQRLSVIEGVIVLAVFILADNLIASAGATMLFGGHASQAQPRLVHQTDNRQPATTSDEQTKVRLLGQDERRSATCAGIPVPNHTISHEARHQDRERHLLVHEGDRKQMARAIADSVRQRQGYASTHTHTLSTKAYVHLLASPQWDELDFNTFVPTENRRTYGTMP